LRSAIIVLRNQCPEVRVRLQFAPTGDRPMKKRFIPLAATAMLFGVAGALAQTDTQSPATTSPSQPSGADQSGAAASSTTASGAAATATAAAGAQAVDTQTFVQAATSSNML